MIHYTSDYKDHVTFEAHEVSGWLEQTQRFVSQVEELLAEILGESGTDK